jgi:hypothetical protein
MPCNCPACAPQCQRTGKFCFIRCEACKGAREEDAIGPLTSRTTRFSIPQPVNQPDSVYSETFWLKLIAAGIIKRPEA